MRVSAQTKVNGTREGHGFAADEYRVTITTKAGKLLTFECDKDGFWEVREGVINLHVPPEIRAKGRL